MKARQDLKESHKEGHHHHVRTGKPSGPLPICFPQRSIVIEEDAKKGSPLIKDHAGHPGQVTIMKLQNHFAYPIYIGAVITQTTAM